MPTVAQVDVTSRYHALTSGSTLNPAILSGRLKAMKVPDRYREIRNRLPIGEMSFGCGRIKLFGVAELEDGQIGNSVAPHGNSLCRGETGAWEPNWLVIGYETACGDPIFIDVRGVTLPVFTAIHGEGTWEPTQIALTIEAFVKCIEEFSRISVGRSNPVERDANPLSEAERTEFLHRIAQANQVSTAPEFWDVLLEA